MNRVPPPLQARSDDPRTAIDECPLLQNLEPSHRDTLRHASSLRHYRAGDHLWHAGEVVRDLFFVNAGMVEIIQPSPRGESTILALFGPGELLCFSAALQGHPYPADAIAIGTEVAALQIPLAPVLAALPNSPGLSTALHQALLDHTAALRAKIGVVCAGSVPRRLAALMLYLIERFGRVVNATETEVCVGLTREQMAQLVSARVETVIRILGRWQKAGWLQTSSGHLRVLRRDMLERILAH